MGDLVPPASWDAPDGRGGTMSWEEGQGVHKPLGCPSYTYFQALVLALKERRVFMGLSTDAELFTMEYKPLMFAHTLSRYGVPGYNLYRWFTEFDYLFTDLFAAVYSGSPNYWLIDNNPNSGYIRSINHCAQVAGYTDVLDPPWWLEEKWGGDPEQTFIRISKDHPLSGGNDIMGVPAAFGPVTSIYLIQRYKMLNVLRYAAEKVRHDVILKNHANSGGDTHNTWAAATAAVDSNWDSGGWEPLGSWDVYRLSASCSGHHTVGPGEEEEDPDIHVYKASKARFAGQFINLWALPTEHDHSGAFWIYMQKYGNEWHENDNGNEDTWNTLTDIPRRNDEYEVSGAYLNSDDSPDNCSAPDPYEYNSGGCAEVDTKLVLQWYFNFLPEEI